MDDLVDRLRVQIAELSIANEQLRREHEQLRRRIDHPEENDASNLAAKLRALPESDLNRLLADNALRGRIIAMLRFRGNI